MKKKPEKLTLWEIRWEMDSITNRMIFVVEDLNLPEKSVGRFLTNHQYNSIKHLRELQDRYVELKRLERHKLKRKNENAPTN